MKTLEFQLESKPFFINDVRNRLPAAFSISSEFTTAGIESLLIGQCLRDWLTDSEKNFLDLLVGDTAILFLIKEGKFLHPEDVELFNMELIETALRESSEAFFCHRLDPKNKTDKHHYKIHTARINISGQSELVVGMLCPETAAVEFEHQNKFCNLVMNFRQAARKIEAAIPVLKQKHDSAMPTLIINRSSGRLLNLNPAAVRLFGREEKQLTDLEYSQFKNQLSRVMAGYCIKMENLARYENSLTVMTLSDEKTVNKNSEPFLADHFLDSIHNKIAGAVTAASYLENLTDIGRVTEETELIEIILSEINDLEKLMNRFRLLLNYDRLPRERINLFNELERAADRINKEYRTNFQINIDPEIGSVRCEVPIAAYLYLFEAVMRSHFESLKEIDAVDIHLVPGEPGGLMSLVFETEGRNVKKTSYSAEQWQNYSRLLTENMKLEIAGSVQDNKIITQITNIKQASE